MPPPPIKVVIRLPYNRRDNAPEDPPYVEWNQEKENILWEVIAKSRATEGGSTDWQGLSAHLQVPLPYLLYRAQARYEQDLRGIQDVQSALLSQKTPDPPLPVSLEPKFAGRLSRSNHTRSPLRLPLADSRNPSSSSNLQTPIIRPIDRPPPLERRVSAQTLVETITSRTKVVAIPQVRSSSPALSEGSESSEEDIRAEEESRREEEQDALSRRLKELEQLMTRDKVGLVQEPPHSAPASVGSEPRGSRSLILNPEKQPESSSVSPQGSIPSIPSPTSGSQSSSQIIHPQKQHPPAVSPTRSPHVGRSPMRYGHFKGRPSEKGSTQGSTASSFSDISEADVSASALESALMSNTRTRSRLTSFARTHFGGGYRTG